MKLRTLLLLLLLPAVALAGPTIKFKSTSFDFGQVDSGRTLDAVYEFENAGSGVLKIMRVIPSCGCTTAELAKNEYQPGERGTITVKFNTSGYSGRVTKSIIVVSNDPNLAETRLIVQGTIVIKDFAQAQVQPDQVAFGACRAGKSYERKLSLRNLGTVDLRILEVSSGPETMVRFSRNLVPPKSAADFTITFTPFDKGKYSNLVKIRTNDYRSPYVFVRLEAKVE